MSEKETDPKKENDEEETAGLQKVTDLARISTSLDSHQKARLYKDSLQCAYVTLSKQMRHNTSIVTVSPSFYIAWMIAPMIAGHPQAAIGIIGALSSDKCGGKIKDKKVDDPLRQDNRFPSTSRQLYQKTVPIFQLVILQPFTYPT